MIRVFIRHYPSGYRVTMTFPDEHRDALAERFIVDGGTIYLGRPKNEKEVYAQACIPHRSALPGGSPLSPGKSRKRK